MTDAGNLPHRAAPNVSVVMTVYNGAKYLRETMDSVLAQTLREFEFICVNDASTDATREIIRSYGDPRIRLIDNKQNLGQSESRNCGMREARAPWIAFTDADDCHHPDRIEAQLRFAEEYNLDLCFCDVTVMKPDGSHEPMPRSDTTWMQKRWMGLFSNPYGAQSSAFLRKDAILRLGGYNPEFQPSEDFDLWERCAAEGLRFGYLPRPMMYYRMVSAGLTATMPQRMEEMTRHIALRALRRIWPEAADETADSLRWLFRGLDTPKAEHSQTLGFQTRGELMRRFFAKTKPSPEECREVWAMVAESLHWRLRRMATWGDRMRLAALWTQAVLRARGKYHFPIARIKAWAGRRIKP